MKIFFGIIILANLFSCAKEIVDPIDLRLGLRKDEYERGIVNKGKKNIAKIDIDSNSMELINPSLSPSKPIFSYDLFDDNKKISFAITQEIDIKDVLIELGRAAKIDVDIDPNISGSIVISANNRSLQEVVERICKLGNLRYKYENNVLHFENDAPYPKNYFVDYLSEESNLWAEVQTNITSIMTNDMMGGMNPMMMGGMMGGQQMMGGVNPQMAGGINPMMGGQMMGGQQMVGGVNPQIAGGINPQMQMMGGQQMMGGMNPMMGGQMGGFFNPFSFISINKTAGIMSVFATTKQHKEIEKYLKDVEKSASYQVLIEAKVVEVALDEEFKTGIDWNIVGGDSVITNSGSFVAGNPLNFVFSGKDMTSSISALEKFGTSRTLSSPRIHAINNQKATLNFTKKLIYFKVENAQANAVGNNNAVAIATTRTSTKIEENVGVELSIVPSINTKTKEITLNVKPKITAEFGERIIDPASPTDENGDIIIENRVPQIKKRELNTIAKVQSGNILVIGGLMEESTSNSDQGVPFLQRIPILGFLFKSVSKRSDVTETVIFIKATIINSASSVPKEDRNLQEKFDTNKRKFF